MPLLLSAISHSNPIQQAVYELSPVIIETVISASLSYTIAPCDSGFNMFSKIVKP